MAVPQKKAVILPLSEERRRLQRVRVSLLGRYLPADRREDFSRRASPAGKRRGRWQRHTGCEFNLHCRHNVASLTP